MTKVVILNVYDDTGHRIKQFCSTPIRTINVAVTNYPPADFTDEDLDMLPVEALDYLEKRQLLPSDYVRVTPTEDAFPDTPDNVEPVICSQGVSVDSLQQQADRVAGSGIPAAQQALNDGVPPDEIEHVLQKPGVLF